MKRIIAFVLCMLTILLGGTAFADSYVVHTVKPGDTYWKISQKYDIESENISKLNNDLSDVLYEGSLVKIGTIGDGTTIKVKVNGEEITTDQPPYIENSRTFIPIRFIAEALSVEDILWDEDTSTVTIKNEDTTICLTVGSLNALINGEKFKLDAPVNIYNDRTFVPIRVIAETLNCIVAWDSINHIVDIKKLTYSGYSEDDIYWLSRIIEAEAKGEPYEGKLAVSNVVINRKNSSQFPNTIKEVIFDKNHGYQFTPVLNGKIYNTPSDESIYAAKEALEGNNNIESCLYFLNPKKSTNSWIVKNRIFYSTINRHDFYI